MLGVTTKRLYWIVGSCLALASGVISCTIENGAVDEAVERQQQGYTIGEFTWSQGQNGVGMGEATSRYFCALTGMGGRFLGDGEEVRVTRVPMKNNPNRYTWFLNGSSQQIQVRARAACVTTRDGYTGETLWSQGEAAKDLGPTNDRVCFLTRVRGHFAGDGEQVRIRNSNGRWLLDGTSQQGGVLGGARCVYASSAYTTLNENWIHSFWNYHWPSNFTAEGGVDDDYCALTHVQGHFVENNGVKVYAGGTWLWWITTYGQPIGVGARCLLHYPVIR